MEHDKNDQNIQPPKLSTGERLTLARKEAMKRGVKFGWKKGVRQKRTLAKEATQKEINLIIMGKADAIVRASIIPALGMTFVYRIDEEKDLKGKVISRKHVLVTDPDEIAEALDQMEEGGQHPDDSYYYVTTRAPEYKAGESLLNRLLGKPKETLGVEVEHKFSLKELGKKADALERKKVKRLDPKDFTVVDSTSVKNVEPGAL